MRNTLITGLAVTALLLSSGCKKKGGDASKSAGSGSGSATAAKAAEAEPEKPAAPELPPVTYEQEPGGGVFPPECKAFAASMQKLAKCKIPKPAKAALAEGYENIMTSWQNWKGMPAAAIKTMGEECQQGAEALKKGAGPKCAL